MIAQIPSDLFHTVDQNESFDIEAADSDLTSLAERKTLHFRQAESPAQVRWQLFQMVLASYTGYVKIADLATSDEIKVLAETIARQRHAQCRALATLVVKDGLRSHIQTPQADEIRHSLFRAFHAVREGDMTTFSEALDRSEWVLEDGYLSAAQVLCTEEYSGDLLDYSLSVYGARLRWDEITVRS
jgi:hypothetical protein